jgi:uncharacterized protein (TIGR02996 family)
LRVARSAPSLAKLEQRLLDHLDDLDQWEVYADALAQAGDPRSELVSLGVALARGEGKRKQLERREQALLEAHADAWFGKLAGDDAWREAFGYTLEQGFFGRIKLWIDYDHKDTDISKPLAYALAHPSGKFLRQLDLGLPNAEGSGDYSACIKAIAKQGGIPSLRSLTIGDFEYPEESEISWVTVGNVGKLWALLPRVETVVLRGAGIVLGELASTSLRSLSLQTGGLPHKAATALAEAKLPALEELSIWFGTTYYGGSCRGRQIPEILANKSFKRLRVLALANADFADEIAGEVARTKLPRSLERLDLSMGTMSDVGGQALLDAAAKLADVELQLDGNYLSTGMCKRLREALPKCVPGKQRRGDDDSRYVTVGE